MSSPVPISFSQLEPLAKPSTLVPFPEDSKTISSDGRKLSYTTVGKTDWWRTPQEARFSGPILGMEVPQALVLGDKAWSVGVELGGEWVEEYDQACLLLYQSATQWIKTGIEFAHGSANISVVAVHPYSDWSLFPSPMSPSAKLKVRIVFDPSTGLAISAILDPSAKPDEWTLIREVRHWPKPTDGGPVWVGVGGCSPHPHSAEGEKEGCKVSFENFWCE